MNTNISACDSIVGNDSIGVFILNNDDSVIFYFHGHVYHDMNNRFWQSVNDIPTLPLLRKVVESSFDEHPHLTFEDFVDKYRYLKSESKLIHITYCTSSDYWRVIRSGFGHRIKRESSAVCAYLSLFENDNSNISAVSYGNRYYAFDSYDSGLCEIKEEAESVEGLHDKIKGLQDGESFISQIYEIETYQTLMCCVLGGIASVVHTMLGMGCGMLLLDTYPFDIYFGPKWGDVIPKIIDKHSTIPLRKSDKFDFAGTDYIGIRIEDKTFEINLTKVFKTIPKEINCEVMLDANSDITFTIESITTQETIDYRFKDFRWN